MTRSPAGMGTPSHDSVIEPPTSMAPAAASASLVVARIDWPGPDDPSGQALAHGQIAPVEDLAVVDVVGEAQLFA